MNRLLSLFLLFVSAPCWSYTVLLYKNTRPIDASSPYHILVAGEPHDLGSLFIQAAASKAARIRELAPQQRIVLYIGNTNPRRVSDAIQLGFEIAEENSNSLSGDNLISELLRFPTIGSLNLFVHSSPQYGSLLQDGESRFDLSLKGLAKIKNLFVEGAYAQLHGCNSGFDHAPGLARIWNIPVFGSLSSMNFQHPWSDGTWYFNDSGLQPQVGNWQSSRTRLAVDNHTYIGMRGEFPVGHGISKVFCSSGENDRCLKGIANQILTSVGVKKLNRSSSREDYFEAVADLLCPVSSKQPIKQNCHDLLQKDLTEPVDNTLEFFQGQTLQCGLKGCQVQISCAGSTCQMSGYTKGPTTTFIDEFHLLMRSFRAVN